MEDDIENENENEDDDDDDNNNIDFDNEEQYQDDFDSLDEENLIINTVFEDNIDENSNIYTHREFEVN